MKSNQLGQRVGSDLVTAFSDPTIDGFGHYMYDDEGTPAKRVYHFDKGIFTEFNNSRQTAEIVNQEPNGHYKATDASLVPLIRMSNTCFAPGDRDQHDIIREVSDGYYVVGHRIPSIAESRENFRITAMKVYEIKNGEIIYKDVGPFGVMVTEANAEATTEPTLRDLSELLIADWLSPMRRAAPMRSSPGATPDSTAQHRFWHRALPKPQASNPVSQVCRRSGLCAGSARFCHPMRKPSGRAWHAGAANCRTRPILRQPAAMKN
jgi:hypothetical protein